MTTRRDRKLEFAANEFEEKEFKAAAELRGMTLSAWIRDACRNQTLRERAQRKRDDFDAALAFVSKSGK